ncbi:hypothetical protein DYB37_001286 [Aphanomyces astaci]|uniref:PX domain-containing protein n=1 Tax=Aphanomyces astaci TaxID=112090 RepID=A0A418FGP2_APHAT|nr:hypothetical protein DYB37_001286 [Aphanomyces astaci]
MWGDSKGSGSSGRQGSSMKADPGKKVVVHHIPTSNQTESADAVVESATSTHARRGDDAHIDEKVFLSYHEASVAMALPEPYVTKRNLKLVLVEDYVRLASFVKSEPFSVSPLGYYKSPDGFDIWKIHRRYRHFDMLLSRLMDPSSSSSSSAAAAARWPSLSGSYLQMFRAKHCKDRLVELHTWLVKAVELLQTFPAPSADTTTGDKSHVLFTCFLFAGANTPYVTFPSLPLFAWALEQVHVQLTLSPLYPSRVPNQHAAGGLGLRLAPSTGRADDETGGTIYRGAVVTGFLRDSFDVPNVQYVRLGSHLSHIHGVSIENETFDTILLHLRSQSRPMFLTFTLDPRPSSLECQLSEADLRRHDRALSASSMISGSRRTSAASSMDVADVQTPMSVLGSVFHDTLGGSRKRTETMISDNNQDEDDGMLMLCWDDVSGLGMDTVTTGMYLPQTPPAASTPTGQDYSLFLNPNSDQAMPLIHRPSMSTSATSPEADMSGLVEAHVRPSAMTNMRYGDDFAQDTTKLIRRCNALQDALNMERVQVQQTAKERRQAEVNVRDADKRLQQKLAAAHDAANRRVMAHEARCIDESRKSIEVAKRAAEVRVKRQVEEALAAQRRQSHLEMQRLAEDNGEEIEFLNQQLTLWKHQVEVLTENDRRRHAHESTHDDQDPEVLSHELSDRRRRSHSHDTRKDQSFWGQGFDPPNEPDSPSP